MSWSLLRCCAVCQRKMQRRIPILGPIIREFIEKCKILKTPKFGNAIFLKVLETWGTMCPIQCPGGKKKLKSKNKSKKLSTFFIISQYQGNFRGFPRKKSCEDIDYFVAHLTTPKTSFISNPF